MKKLVCLLLAFWITGAAALAQSCLITGDVSWLDADAKLEMHWSESGLSGSLTGDINLHFDGAPQPDGTFLLACDQTLALRLPSLPNEEILAPLLQALTGTDAYQAARHSSFFIQAQQVELSADEVCAYALRLLQQYPLLDADGSLRAALASAGGQETWATVTRYMADQQQYPDGWLLQINVFAPILPNLMIAVQSGGKDSKDFTIALSNAPVSDWDETIAAMQEQGVQDGLLITGFRLVFDDVDETDTYIEANVYWRDQQYTLEMDRYTPSTGTGDWSCQCTLRDDQEAALLTLDIVGTPTDDLPAPTLVYTTLLDVTDGLDDNEKQLLGL